MEARNSTTHHDVGVTVHLSAEGLRRAANDNALKRKAEASGVIEIVAYCAAMAVVVFLTAWIVNVLAGALG